MTITSTVNSVTYIGDGTTRAFPFTWAGDESYVKAELISTNGVETATTDFTVAMTPAGAGLWSPGGTVTYPASGSDAALPVGWSIKLYRLPPATQETELRNQGAFLPVEIEKALDRAAMRDQRMLAVAQDAHDAVMNAIQLPEDGPWILSDATSRKGLFLLFDSVTGAPTLGNPSPGTLNAFWATVVATSTQADAMRTLANGPVLRFAVNAIQNAPPGSPATNDQYLVGTAGSGAWSGYSNQIARWTGAAWTYLTPTFGFQVYTAAGASWVYNGSAWVDSSITAPVVGEYETRAAAAAVTIPGATLIVRTAGYATSGDGGAAVYKRRVGAPSHAAYFQDASSAYFEIIDDILTFEMLGAVGDGTTDDTTAINNACATGRSIRLIKGKTYRATGQLTMGAVADGQRLFCEGGRYGATLKLEYNGGPCILVGATASTPNCFTMENFQIDQQNASVQYVFRVRKQRTFTLKNMRMNNIYAGMELGTATDACYITELYGNEVGMRLSGCLYFVNVVNSYGQFDWENTYVEGPYTGGSMGIRCNANVQSTWDHVVIRGGYLSRFEYNMYIAARVTNVHIGDKLLMEGHIAAAIYFHSTASFENVQIEGMTFGAGYVSSSAYYHIYCGIGQTTQGCDGLQILNNLFNICRGQDAVTVFCNSANRINGLLIQNCSFLYCIDSTDNNHSAINLNQINTGLVNNIQGRCTDVSKRFAWLVLSTNSQAGLTLAGTNFSASGFFNAAPAISRT